MVWKEEGVLSVSFILFYKEYKANQRRKQRKVLKQYCYSMDLDICLLKVVHGESPNTNRKQIVIQIIKQEEYKKVRYIIFFF